MALRSEHPVRRRSRLAATSAATLLAVGAVGALGGCGGDAGGRDAAASSSPSVTTSTADSSGAAGSEDAAAGRLVGQGYALTLPPGWQEATDQFKEYSPLIDAGALNATQAGLAFNDNVNVLRNADQTELPLDVAERQFADELGTVASRVRVQDPTTVDGVPAVHLTGRTRAGEVVALTDQFISFVDGAYYVVTFSYSSATPQAAREEEVAAMLASWAWE